MAYVRLNRRRFLQQTAATAAGLFTLVPRQVLGGAGHLPPSETLNIAGIGIGRRGYVDLVEVSRGGCCGSVSQAATSERRSVKSYDVVTNWPLHVAGLRRFDEQVEVVGHQARRMDLPAGLGAGLRQRVRETLPVGVVAEGGLPTVTPIEDVINRPPGYSPLSFLAEARSLSDSASYVNIKNRPLFDPFSTMLLLATEAGPVAGLMRNLSLLLHPPDTRP